MATAEEREELRGMGSTVVAVIMRDDLAWFAHVGDSRIYLLRGTSLMVLTKDHTMVQRMVDDGFLTLEAAEHHPSSHVLSRSLGGREAVEVDVSGAPVQLEVGDTFLLCSDGLTGHLSDTEIAQVLIDYDPHTAARVLLDETNDRGGFDNTTVAVVRVRALPVFSSTQSLQSEPTAPTVEGEEEDDLAMDTDLSIDADSPSESAEASPEEPDEVDTLGPGEPVPGPGDAVDEEDTEPLHGLEDSLAAVMDLTPSGEFPPAQMDALEPVGMDAIVEPEPETMEPPTTLEDSALALADTDSWDRLVRGEGPEEALEDPSDDGFREGAAHPEDLAHRVVNVDPDGVRIEPHTPKVPPRTLSTGSSAEGGAQSPPPWMLFAGTIVLALGFLVGVLVGRAPVSKLEGLVKALQTSEADLRLETRVMSTTKIPALEKQLEESIASENDLLKKVATHEANLRQRGAVITDLRAHSDKLEAELNALKSTAPADKSAKATENETPSFP
jgi:hypothetical protein